MLIQLTNDIKHWEIMLEGENDIIEKMTMITNRFKVIYFENEEQVKRCENLISITRKTNNDYCIKYRDSVYMCNTISEALFIVYEAIDFYTKNAEHSKMLSTNYCILHGGSVSYGDHTIGVLAPSYTGKSSMICELVTRGFNYISDDYLFYRAGKIIPFQLPLRLRNIRYISNDVRKYIMLEGTNPYTHGYEYLLNFRPENKEQQLDSLWILQRKSNANIQINKMNSRDAFVTLVLNEKRSESSEIINNYSALLEISKNVPVYVITYSETVDGATEIIRWIGENRYDK